MTKRLPPTLLLLLMFSLALTSLRNKSPTFDEQSYIVRGLGYLRGQNRHMRVGHPLGLNALNASLLVNDPTVTLPTNHPSWQATSFHRPAELFLWEIGNNVEHVIFLARLPSLWLGLLFASLVYRWAWQMAGRHTAGLIALTLIALDPNILAHTRLTTTDLGLAVGATFAGYAFWQFFRTPTWRNITLAGLAFGLLQNTKFTAGLFVPIFALIILIELGLAVRRWPLADSRKLLIKLAAFPLIAFLTLWACYGFDIGTLPENLPTLSQLSGRTLPLAHHLEQLLDIGGRVQKTTPAFLLGNYSDNGWWYYFPITLLLKTPLPTLLLLALAIRQGIKKYLTANHPPSTTHYPPSTPHTPHPTLHTLLPAGLYLLIALTTNINIGYRHLLPLLPFLYIYIATQLSHWPLATGRWPKGLVKNKLPFYRRRTKDQGRICLESPGSVLHPPSFVKSLCYFWTNPNAPHPTLYILLIWLAASTLLIHPHYLAYFNPLAGGPDNGWQALVDSNIDWGQDLVGLSEWLHEDNYDHVWLSYFGEARPEHYHIPYTGLESNPPRLMNPHARPYNPHNPAPGLYAISVTNLVGATLDNKDTFAWFRDRDPIAKIGYSIFLYDVPATGLPHALALGGLQLDQIPPPALAPLQTNDLTPHWFDPATSLLLPANPRRHLLLGDGQTLNPTLLPLANTLFAPTPTNPFADWQPANVTFLHETGHITLNTWQLTPETPRPGTPLTLHTTWTQHSQPQPLKIFIHLLDSNNQIVAQWDGLGATWEGWRNGDLLVQLHTMTLPNDLPAGTNGLIAGTYTLTTGLYNPHTNIRWQTTTHDHHTLTTLQINP